MLPLVERCVMDVVANFKNMQREGWRTFTPFELVTGRAAPELVRFADVTRGQRVLDVACGTGVVALTAARLGAQVTGLDLTPDLLARAKENSQLAGVEITWREGDAEALPFEDASFDVVLSQFGHMFAPRPEVAIAQMLRVLKPGGTIAFSTWPPDLMIGRMFALTGSFMPPLPPGVSPPIQWGVPQTVRDRLGAAVSDVRFDMGTIYASALSPAHFRDFSEHNAGPVLKLVERLRTEDPAKLAEFRKQFDALAAQYFAGNAIRQDFLMTRAIRK
jgi:SAM-dependent methyltransferase